MRVTNDREYWEAELEFINNTSHAYPGTAFNDSPYVFGDYCYMQARFARDDGFLSIAQEIEQQGKAARECARVVA